MISPPDTRRLAAPTAPAAGAAARRAPGWAGWLRQRTALLGAGVVVLYLVAAVAAPWIAPHPPDRGDLSFRMAPPVWMEGGSASRLLGADSVGRDLLSRIIYGARASLAIGLLSVLAATTIGVGLGALAGYYRGWLDGLVSRLAEFLLAFPMLIFAIGALAVLGPGFWSLVLALSFKAWVEFFRLVRGQVLAEGTREYVEAARAVGAGDARVLVRHLLPNVAHAILVLATLRVGYLIIMEASLSFLGLGVQPPTPAWGTMVADGRSFMLDAWWIATFPGLALLGLVLGLNLLGEGLRDALDPGLRGRG